MYIVSYYFVKRGARLKSKDFRKVLADTLEIKPCGFKYWKPCTKECKYFNTCTRNPYKKGDKK